MRDRDSAEIIEGPEPPVAALAELDPREEVPPHLDRAVRGEIRRRLRFERIKRPWWTRTPVVASISAAGAAAATVVAMFAIQPVLEGEAGPTAKGVGSAVTPDVHLDYLVQHPRDESPSRLERGERVAVGDAVYLRADLNRPGMLTFLADSPATDWEALATQRGEVGANDLQRDGRVQVFYVTEAGLYRFAAVWSQGRPPADWTPGDGETPSLESLGDDVEVAWVEIETHSDSGPP